ncbi:hypothetical protein RhiXN_07139 [Rhizoctonia solani]|uniref:Serine hydrolase domain-containing protein n=1 Tax=Rhizoctonia solani TaxID=456999 RepID=A0A8H8P4V5_9AGAM|nr:uncharacterized protein RhiXN_07139 [Rhizoctonia solani]QRW25190.1 hypothetical protein RhiXN_07139 [Rhizoctonia solani]
MIRILALHGYAQSAEIFKKKMGVLRKACGKNVEFVFLDAPVLLQPADLPQSFASVEALDTVKAPPEEPELQPRAWWRANLDRTVYYHVPETIEYLKNYLKDQRFNGVFGFNELKFNNILHIQLEQPEAYPAILVDGKPRIHHCHFVPSKANWRNFFKDYFLSFDPVLGGKPVPSPGPAGDTPAQTPGSGTPAEISRVGTPSKI